MKIENSYSYARVLLGGFSNSSIGEITSFTPRLQDDYGDVNDCTLTSISSVMDWLLEDDFSSIYSKILDISKRSLAYTRHYGTNPFMVKYIFNKLLGVYNVGYKCKTLYLKSVGYNFNVIESVVRSNKPVILTVKSANNDYYQWHSVSVIGVERFKSSVDEVLLLKVYDNWSKKARYIDYKTVSFFSSIYYIAD